MSSHKNIAKKRVVVIGGGVAGLTLATLLSEAFEEVLILESSDSIGGLAKSTRSVKNLPAEHSLRAYHKTYDCLFKIYKQIPYNEKETVYQQLVPVSFVLSKNEDNFSMYVDKKPHWFKGIISRIRFLNFLIKEGFQWRDLLQLVKEEIMARFSLERLMNRANVPLNEFLKNVSPSYLGIIDANHTIAFAATKETSALLAIEFDIEAKPFDFFLMTNGPTSEQSLLPWEKYLIHKGVSIRNNANVIKLFHTGETISSVELTTGERIEGDVFVCATSGLDFKKLIEQSSLQDKIPDFVNIKPYYSWSGGAQFYLTDLPLANGVSNPFFKPGVLQAYLDSPWKLVSIVQGGNFWKTCPLPAGCQYIISVTFTNPFELGCIYKKPLLECTPEEILNELLEQIKLKDRHLIIESRLDDMIRWMNNENYEKEKSNLPGHLSHQRKDGDWILHFSPYYVPTPYNITHSPSARTNIKNLFLAGVHCQTAFFVPTMEKACESGYRAALAISKDFNLNGKIELPFKSYNTKNHAIFRTLDAIIFKIFEINCERRQ